VQPKLSMSEGHSYLNKTSFGCCLRGGSIGSMARNWLGTQLGLQFVVFKTDLIPFMPVLVEIQSSTLLCLISSLCCLSIIIKVKFVRCQSNMVAYSLINVTND
jgi:hypothetical protein